MKLSKNVMIKLLVLSIIVISSISFMTISYATEGITDKDSLQSAITSAESNNGTVTLTQDIKELSGTISVKGSVTLELNDKTISSKTLSVLFNVSDDNAN